MLKKDNLLPPILLNDVSEIIDRIRQSLVKMEGKTILISGAAGFLPSYLVHTLAYANTYLFKKQSNVICIDNFQTGTPERLKPWEKVSGIKLLTKDITKPLNINEKLDYIFHCASIASPVWYRKFPLETIDVNVVGTRQLLDLAHSKKVKSFVYLSSSEIYGDPFKEFIPTSEDYFGNVSSMGPRACYDESKRLGETLCMVYFRKFGTPIKIIRPFNVYGPGLRLDDGRVVADFIKNVIQKKPITIFSDGQSTRSFCYVTDAIVAMFLLLTNKIAGEAYNVGNDQEVTITDLAKVVNKVGNSKAGIKFVKSSDKAYLTDNPQRRVPNLKKIKQTIKWTPEVSLKTGIERTIKFYLDGGFS